MFGWPSARGAWREHNDDDRGTMDRSRRAKVCETCRKIILRFDDLVRVKDEGYKLHTYCAKCAPRGEDDAGG